MGDYYVVTEAEPGGEFVAGFGDADLAVAFAITEAAEGRHLAVISSATGECLYTNLPDLSHTTPPRNSMLRVRPSPRSED